MRHNRIKSLKAFFLLSASGVSARVDMFWAYMLCAHKDHFMAPDSMPAPRLLRTQRFFRLLSEPPRLQFALQLSTRSQGLTLPVSSHGFSQSHISRQARPTYSVPP